MVSVLCYRSENACVWPDDNKGSIVDWDAGTVGVFGSGGMADYLGENDYAIGYLDAGHGHSLNLEEIALQNKDLNYLKSKDADIAATLGVALAKNVLPADATTSFAAVNLYDLSGPDTWPITMMSYFYIRQDLSGLGASGTLLKVISCSCTTSLLPYTDVCLRLHIANLHTAAASVINRAQNTSENDPEQVFGAGGMVRNRRLWSLYYLQKDRLWCQNSCSPHCLLRCSLKTLTHSRPCNWTTPRRRGPLRGAPRLPWMEQTSLL